MSFLYNSGQLRQPFEHLAEVPEGAWGAAWRSFPDHHQIGALADLVQIGALADLVPGPGIRAMLPLAPVAAVVLLLAAVWLAPGPGRRSGRGS
jgi:hypothetical protein